MKVLTIYLTMPGISKDSVNDIVINHLEERDTRLSDLETRVANLEAVNKNLTISVVKLQVDVTQAHLLIDRLTRVTDDNMQYSKKQNIIIDGLKISKSDNDAKIRQMVLDEIHRLNIDIDDHDIDRAHRIESQYRDNNGKLHTPIIVRFTSWYAKNELHEARKSARFHVRADLTPRRKDLLNDAKRSIADDNSRAATYFEYAFVDKNCQISVKSKDGRNLKFNSMDEFRSLVDYVEETRPPNLLAWKVYHYKKFKLIEPRIVNLHKIKDIAKWMEDDDHVYVGRQRGNIEASLWGNPFSLEDHDVETSLRLYEEHVTSSEELSSSLGSLKNKCLGCWCADADKCHSSVLLRLVGSSIE